MPWPKTGATQYHAQFGSRALGPAKPLSTVPCGMTRKSENRFLSTERNQSYRNVLPVILGVIFVLFVQFILQFQVCLNRSGQNLRKSKIVRLTVNQYEFFLLFFNGRGKD